MSEEKKKSDLRSTLKGEHKFVEDTLEQKLRGRAIRLSDGCVYFTPPITYDQFVETEGWENWGSSSDLAFASYCREFGFTEVDDFNDETLAEGFEVLPSSKEIEALVRPVTVSFAPQIFVEEVNPLDCQNLRQLAEEYRQLMIYSYE
jgi:hypothetical protein